MENTDENTGLWIFVAQLVRLFYIQANIHDVKESFEVYF
jgi:hypothetical protein